MSWWKRALAWLVPKAAEALAKKLTKKESNDAK